MWETIGGGKSKPEKINFDYKSGEPNLSHQHQRGEIPEAPGVYFVDLPFQSALIGGVGAEAECIVSQIT
jgi:hypothetical protein